MIYLCWDTGVRFPANSKPAEIADYSLPAITDAAYEFIANYVVPEMIVRSPRKGDSGNSILQEIC